MNYLARTIRNLSMPRHVSTSSSITLPLRCLAFPCQNFTKQTCTNSDQRFALTKLPRTMPILSSTQLHSTLPLHNLTMPPHYLTMPKPGISSRDSTSPLLHVPEPYLYDPFLYHAIASGSIALPLRYAVSHCSAQTFPFFPTPMPHPTDQYQALT